MDKPVPSDLFVFSSRHNRLTHTLFQILARILLFVASIVVAISGAIAPDDNANGRANVTILVSVLALLSIVISGLAVATRGSHDIGSLAGLLTLVPYLVL